LRDALRRVSGPRRADHSRPPVPGAVPGGPRRHGPGVGGVRGRGGVPLMPSSVHEAILDVVGATLEALNLEQAPGNPLTVYRRTSLADVALGQNITFPACVYGPDGMEASQ